MALRERRAQFGAFLARVGTTCGATQTSFHLRRDVDETTLKKVGLLCRSRAGTLCSPYLAHVCHLQIRKYAHSLLTRTETTAPCPVREASTNRSCSTGKHVPLDCSVRFISNCASCIQRSLRSSPEDVAIVDRGCCCKHCSSLVTIVLARPSGHICLCSVLGRSLFS